jgi:DNA replication protein DnaC
MNDHNSELDELDVVVLSKCMDGWLDEALVWMRKEGWLKPEEGLEGLTAVRWRRIFNNLDSFKRAVFPELKALYSKEREAKAEVEAGEERNRQEEEARSRRIRQLCNIRPMEYGNLSEAKSPRPIQFKLVSNFLTDDDSLYFTEAGDRIHGLVPYGKPRSGKTAACWQLVANYWHANPLSSVEFIKAVKFVGKAKSRHMGIDAKEEFDELFTRAINCDLLVLDDLGSEKMSESADEVMFELIDTRTEEWRFTVITSNCSLRTIAGTFMPRNQAKMEARLRQFFLPICFDK